MHGIDCGNVLWLVSCGWGMALGWLFGALILAITIVGLPFGRTVVRDPEASGAGASV